MGTVNRNISPPTNCREPTDQGGFLYSCVQTARRPVEWLRSALYPYRNPADILIRINKSASDGIKRAQAKGLAIVSRSALHNNELNHLLNQRGMGKEALTRGPDRGETANLERLSHNPETTRAPGLQGRVEATNWMEKKEKMQNKLKDKLSVFTALVQMRNRAGIKDENNLKIMSLVNRATEGTNPVSVWNLFSTHYDKQLGFFGKLFAAWFYWGFYQTSLITNTIRAYLGGFIDSLTEDLTKESSGTRTKVFRALIENTNSFLLEDLKATKAYAKEQESGLLKDIRNRSIERQYGFSLRTLCETFSAYRVEKDSPRVKFFEEFQKNLPKGLTILKYVFQFFEYLVNRLIIQRTMINSILPEVLESAVNNGLAATQPDNLPFAITMTQFFTSQLDKLRTILESKEAPTNLRSLAGTEMLPSTIELLIEVLSLEGEQTPTVLRKKIAKLDKGDRIEERVVNEIAKALANAGKALFLNLDETARSNELFARFLELSLAPFSGEEKTEEMLRSQYEEEYSLFERTATSIFKNLIRKAVSNEGNDTSTQIAQAKQSLLTQKTITCELVTKLNTLCNTMQGKVIRSAENPNEENDVQGDIVQLLQIMQVLASRKELQDELEPLDSTHRNEIWKYFSPLFEKIEELQLSIRYLQGVSNQYMQHTSMVTHFHEMRALLTTVQSHFKAQPRHLQSTLIQSMKKICERITKTSDNDALISQEIREIIKKADTLSRNVVAEQSAMDAIQTLLYLPRVGGEPEGLLMQQRRYQKGEQIYGFRYRDWKASVEKSLGSLPIEERKQLSRLIGNGSKIEENWDALESILENFLTRHYQKKNENLALLNKEMQNSQKWIDNKINEYNYIKSEDHRKMQSEMEKISSGMAKLQKDAEQVSDSVSFPISRGIWKTLSVAAPLVGTYYGMPTLGSLIGGAGFTWLKPSKRDGEENFFNATVSRCATLGTAVLTSLYLPSWVPSNWVQASKTGSTIVTSALAGSAFVNTGKSFVEDRAFNKLWDIFKRAYELSHDQRVYKAAMTRAMLAMIKAG